MKKLLSVFIALMLFGFTADAQKVKTTTVTHKTTNHFTDGTMDVKTTKSVKPTSNLTLNGGHSLRKPTNNLGGAEIGKTPKTKTTVKHK